MILAELINSWMKERQTYLLKERTYLRYSEIIRTQIIPGIGNTDLKDLTVSVLQAFQRQKLKEGNMINGKPLASNTVKCMMSVLKGAIDYGRELGMPVCDIRAVKPPHTEEKPICAYRRDEQKKLEATVMKSKKPNHFGIILCLYTGLRLGELLALTWEDIDFQSGLLKVDKTSAFLKGGDGKYKFMVERPKTESSVRMIPIPKPILKHLKALKRSDKSEFVISTRNGTRVGNRTYQTTYKRIVEKSGIAYKNFHALRHTFATRALECGTDIKTLSELMGHKSPTVTMNRYLHSMMETKRRAMNTIAKNLVP